MLATGVVQTCEQSLVTSPSRPRFFPVAAPEHNRSSANKLFRLTPAFALEGSSTLHGEEMETMGFEETFESIELLVCACRE